MQQALAQVTTSTSSQNGSPPDTSQIRDLIRTEFIAMQAEKTSVTETVTETLARDLPGLVRQLVEGLALEALGLPVTDTCSNDTDTMSHGEGTARMAPQRTRGEMRQRILTLLGEHPAPRSSGPRSGVGRPANTRRHDYIRATGEPDHSWCP